MKERIKVEKPEKAVVDSIDFEVYHHSIPPIERSMQVFQMEHRGKAIPIVSISDKLEETNTKLELLRSDLRDHLENNMKELNVRISRI